MPTVLVPTPYRGPTRGEGAVLVSGETVLGCLQAVEEKFPGFLAQIVDERGEVHRFVRLFVNGAPLGAGGLDRPLEADDRLEVLAAIAGG